MMRVLFHIILAVHCIITLLPLAINLHIKPEASGERAVLEMEVGSEDNPGEFSVGICIVVTI